MGLLPDRSLTVAALMAVAALMSHARGLERGDFSCPNITFFLCVA